LPCTTRSPYVSRRHLPLQNGSRSLGKPRKNRVWINFPWKKSTRRSRRLGRLAVNVGHRSNDSRRPRHEYPDFCFASATGPAARIFLMTIAGTAAQLCVSGDVYANTKKSFGVQSLTIPKPPSSTLFVHSEKRTLGKASRTGSCLFRSDDDIFIECAQAAHAHYLITGNRKDFPRTGRHADRNSPPIRRCRDRHLRRACAICYNDKTAGSGA